MSYQEHIIEELQQKIRDLESENYRVLHDNLMLRKNLEVGDDEKIRQTKVYKDLFEAFDSCEVSRRAISEENVNLKIQINQLQDKHLTLKTCFDCDFQFLQAERAKLQEELKKYVNHIQTLNFHIAEPQSGTKVIYSENGYFQVKDVEDTPEYKELLKNHFDIFHEFQNCTRDLKQEKEAHEATKLLLEFSKQEYQRLEQDKCEGCLRSHRKSIKDGPGEIIWKHNPVLDSWIMQISTESNESTKSLEYQLLENNYKQAQKKITDLTNLCYSRQLTIDYQQDKIWTINSEKSDYFNKYFHLKDQIKLIMEAGLSQRLARQNSKGVSYEQIKLEPDY
jgi:hypothetical protein